MNPLQLWTKMRVLALQVRLGLTRQGVKSHFIVFVVPKTCPHRPEMFRKTLQSCFPVKLQRSLVISREGEQVMSDISFLGELILLISFGKLAGRM